MEGYCVVVVDEGFLEVPGRGLSWSPGVDSPVLLVFAAALPLPFTSRFPDLIILSWECPLGLLLLLQVLPPPPA